LVSAVQGIINNEHRQLVDAVKDKIVRYNRGFSKVGYEKAIKQLDILLYERNTLRRRCRIGAEEH